MKLSNNGLKMIEGFEGLRLDAYQDAGGTWTIGYGHTGLIDGQPLCQGMTITPAKAEELLACDVANSESEVDRYQLHYNFNQNQYDAMVSFDYNIGSLRQITQNGTRSYDDIALHMPEYNHCGGQVNTGLTQRRRKEQLLFNIPMPCEKSNEAIAKEVVAGKWGNGTARRIKLQAAGYDYATIQAIVNKLLR